MATLLENNVFEKEFVTKSFNTVVSNMNSLLGEELMPETPRRVQLVKILRREPIQGITGATVYNAESNVVTPRSKSLVSYEPLQFRDKILMEGDDLVRLVNFKEDPQTASQILTEHLEELAMRSKLKMEALRFEAMCGTLSIDENNVKVDIDYNFPAAFKPTVGTSWSSVATANPIEDLIKFARVFNDEASGYRPKMIIMNEKTFQNIVQNSTVRDQMTNIGAGQTQLESITRLIDIGHSIELRVYDEGYVDASGTFIRFVSNDTVFMVGQSKSDNSGIGEFTTTLHPYMGIENLQPGMFGVIKDTGHQDPPSAELIAGFYGLPALNSNKAILCADVS